MKKPTLHPSLLALCAAVLFGASTPLSKWMLGDVRPVVLSALLYLGSGLGLLVLRLSTRSARVSPETKNEPIGRRDIPWLAAMVLVGGVAAPILLMYSLRLTPAATASMLLNFEAASTAMIAALFFKEKIGRRIWVAILSITVACGLLSWVPRGSFEISIGAVGVLLTCVLWGVDNNLANRLSSRDPLTVVTVKSLGAGTLSLVLAFLAGDSFPTGPTVGLAMLLGFLSYGTSIVLLVRAMRFLGAARASGIFCVAPFLGSFLSLVAFRESPGLLFYLFLPLLLFGVWLIIEEKHTHPHAHGTVVHTHLHAYDRALRHSH